MPNPKFRIPIPRNPSKFLSLAADIYESHLNKGDESPFKLLNKNNWAENGEKIAVCLALHERAEEMKRKMEEAYAERNLLLNDIIKTVRASRDLLLGINNDNPKQLLDWGFEVNDSPHRKKKKEAQKKEIE